MQAEVAGPVELTSALAEELARWPAPAGVCVVGTAGPGAEAGELVRALPWASVTKVLVALTVLRLQTHGLVYLDDRAGPPGSTLRHLLAHASGLAFDSDKVMAEPGVRRIYSNRGIELAVQHVESRAGRPFDALLSEHLLSPLGMGRTRLLGSPAHGAEGPVQDLARLARELLDPRHLTTEEVATASSTAYPRLAGVLPGFGRQEPNDWGLGVEVRGVKSPHWTSPTASPTSFGHFGQSGSFLWVDPQLGVACVAAGAAPFGPWAAEAWPRLFARVLQQISPATSPDARGARG